MIKGAGQRLWCSPEMMHEHPQLHMQLSAGNSAQRVSAIVGHLGPSPTGRLLPAISELVIPGGPATVRMRASK